MNHPITRLAGVLVAAAFLLNPSATATDHPLTLDLWPGGKAHQDHGSIGPERIRESKEAPTPDATWITNVTRPSLTLFQPDPATHTRAAVLVCPGGGYWNLAWDKEGTEVAAWLNSLGISAAVLKYRVPRRPGEPEPRPAPGPLLDAQRALSLLRAHARDWNLDPDRIGVIGFSAGGHLALKTAITPDRAYTPIDDTDRQPCKPSFALIAYPGYVLDKPGSRDYAPDIRIPPDTCPVFLVHAGDDAEPGAQPEQSLALYAALRKAGIPTELHIYPTGKHGFGVRKSGLAADSWTDHAADWLALRNIIPPRSQTPAQAALEPLPEGNTGIAARFPGDRGIARDPAVLFHDDFESGNPTDRWDMAYHQPNIRLANEPELVLSGKRALEFTVPQTPDEVSNELVKRLDPAQHVVFLRFYSRYDPEFDPVGSSHNGALLAAIAPSLPFATPGIKADGANKFSASFEAWRGEPETPSPGQLNIYCYYPAQRSEYGDHFFPSGTVLPFSAQPGDFGPHFQPRLDITPKLGRWYCFEYMLQANTPGQANGRIACWLDGKLIADFPNLRLRSDPNLKINHAGIGLHIKSNPHRINRKWYDDVVIATRYIGPRAAPPPDQPPPSSTLQRHDRPPRKTLIGTTMTPWYSNYPGLDARIAQIRSLLKEMSQQANERYGRRLDLALFSEFALTAGQSGPAQDVALPLDEPLRVTLGKLAADHHCYLALGGIFRIQPQKPACTNAVILFDRQGQLIGRYDKLHPVLDPTPPDPPPDTTPVFEGGVQPGSRAPIFDLDFGRVGFQICYDIEFPEGWQQLADQQADLVLFPTQSPQLTRPAMYAGLHGYWLVSATFRNNASVFEPGTGLIAAQLKESGRTLVHEIDTSFLVLPWSPRLQNGRAFQDAFGNRVGFHYSESEDRGVFWSNDPATPIGQMARQLNLLETPQEQHARARAAYSNAPRAPRPSPPHPRP